MTIDLHAKFQGALIGAALGDAIGEQAFNALEREALLMRIEETELLRYTDDTVMTLALAELLIQTGEVDPQLLGSTLHAHYREEPWRGYGPGPREIFTLVEEEGIGYREAAQRLHGGEGSFGNGAAMRVAPVGLYFHALPPEALCAKARESAAVTHTHPVGMDGAALQALAVATTVPINVHRPFSPQAFLARLLEQATTSTMKQRLQRLAELLDAHASPEEAASALGLGIAVQESLPFALYSFLSHPHTFMECLLCAVTHGGDRDTMGAMAGALSGAYLGIEAVPDDWRRRLENNQHIETVARELAARAAAP